MNGRNAGMSIVEVMLALFLLSLSAAVVLRLVRDADAVRGRSMQIAAAARLADSEAERIRQSAAMGYALDDTSYLRVSDGLALEVRRSVLRPEAYDLFVDSAATVTVDIAVWVPQAEEALLTMRMIQGYD